MADKKLLLDNEWIPTTSIMLAEISASDKGTSSYRRYSVFRLGLTYFTILFTETLILALLAWIISLQLSVNIKDLLDSSGDVFKMDSSRMFSEDSELGNCCTGVDVNQELKKVSHR